MLRSPRAKLPLARDRCSQFAYDFSLDWDSKSPTRSYHMLVTSNPPDSSSARRETLQAQKSRISASWRRTAARSPDTHHRPPRLSGRLPTAGALAPAPAGERRNHRSAWSAHLRGTRGRVKASGGSIAWREHGEVESSKPTNSCAYTARACTWRRAAPLERDEVALAVHRVAFEAGSSLHPAAAGQPTSAERCRRRAAEAERAPS